MSVWPDGKSIAVSLIVAWESWPPELGTSRSHQMKSQQPLPPGAKYDRDMWVIYDHLYAQRQGIDRLLRTLDRHSARATFVTNGKRVEESSQLAIRVRDAGHDMGCENYIHEYPVMMTPEQERESIAQTVKAFESVLGAPPTGYISPGHRPTPATIDIIMEAGLSWDADFQDDDQPFLMRAGERDLVGMPYAHLSDYQTYPGGGRSPRQVLEMLIDEYNCLRAEAQAGAIRMMGFAVHPFLLHGFRIVMVDEFLAYISQHADTWIATRSEIADWVRAHPGDFPERARDEVLQDFELTP